jgi:hypothetical protein
VAAQAPPAALLPPAAARLALVEVLQQHVLKLAPRHVSTREGRPEASPDGGEVCGRWRHEPRPRSCSVLLQPALHW